jgi:crotonobetainyl-CoA:carnitine CoA-transferase CaiB-like acyl-CoA transferase
MPSTDALLDALAGIRVLDFTQAWSGPTCARLLGDYGADVIKVESRTAPDIGRIVGPWQGPVKDPEGSGFFVEWNRNKRSILLNMKEEDDRRLALRLAAEADVVVDNFSPRVMPSFGLAYEQLREVNPDVIQCSISGFGATGPDRLYPAYGQQVEAITGMMHSSGYPGGEPMKTGVSFPDPTSGLGGAAAIAMALIHRERTGEGQFIDAAMIEVVEAQLGLPLMAYLRRGEEAVKRGNASPWWPVQGMYRCAGDDYWIAIECHDADEVAALSAVAGIPGGELQARLGEFTAGKDPHRLAEQLQAAGIPAAVAEKTSDLMSDEHLLARGFWLPIEDQPKMGHVVTSGVMGKLTKTPGRIHRPAPLIGEHHDEVMAELGVTVDG